ncbi:hypothetical protein D3C71_2193410 [compost metagenome]
MCRAEAAADQQIGIGSGSVFPGDAVVSGIICAVERIGMHLQAKRQHDLAPVCMTGKD